MALLDTRRRQLIRSRVERAAAGRRRGVIMLVVLSMLVLFMLVGTTFLITSGQYRQASRIIEKAGRATQQPEDLLERALMQLLRDTGNRYSAARYHSLLRDTYGVDGFVARVVASATPNEISLPALAAIDMRPHYAGVNPAVRPEDAPNGGLGTTDGQLVDLYVLDLAGSDLLADSAAVSVELNPETNLPFDHQLSTVSGYYNGCLLTMTEGPCQGVSVRVVDYDAVGSDTVGTETVVVGRLRVMAPKRIDNQRLTLGGSKAANASVLTDFMESAVRGYEFVVNGRPYNGIGVGYNTFAGQGRAQLSTLEGFGFDDTTDGSLVAGPIGLLPHARMHRRTVADGYNMYIERQGLRRRLTTDGFPSGTPLYNTFAGPGGSDESYDAADFQNLFLALQPLEPRARGRVVPQTGGVLNTRGEPNPVEIEAFYTESGTPLRVDIDNLPIPSFHRPALVNYWLHQLLNAPWLASAIGDQNARARAILQPYVNGVVNPNVAGLNDTLAQQITSIKRRYILRPLREDHPGFDGSNPLSRYDRTALATAINSSGLVRTEPSGVSQVTFPYWEIAGPWDVDNNGDGVPDSVWVDLGLPIQKTEDGRLYKPLVAVLIEDLDGRLNLNAHGSSEHFVNDDLDLSQVVGGGQLNANLAQDYANLRPLQTSNQLASGAGWGPADITLRSILSPDLPLRDAIFGSSLTNNSQYDDYKRIFGGRPLPSNGYNTFTGNLYTRNVSAAVNVGEQWGRWGADQPPSAGVDLLRPGISANLETLDPTTFDRRALFDYYTYPQLSPTGAAALLPIAPNPLLGNLLRLGVSTVSGYGAVPDLRGRYANALSGIGVPVNESERDGFTTILRPLSLDIPYEVNLSGDSRRQPAAAGRDAITASYAGTAPLNDDAPFSPGELERVLRAFDADAADLPGRLWDIVDAFDPEKLAVQSAITRGGINVDNFVNYQPSTVERVVAESQAAINRRQVTTESWDIPAPNENWTQRCLLGADGLPGVRSQQWASFATNIGDDDGDGAHDEGDELLAPRQINIADGPPADDPNPGLGITVPNNPLNDSDDYDVVMSTLGLGQLPPPNARITDYLRYRIAYELLRRGDITFPPDAAEINRQINNILLGPDGPVAVGATRGANLNDPASFGGLLAPEVLAGRKMNLNRPFGDGRDNGDGVDNDGNGFIDDPAEYGNGVDDNGNGIVDDIREGVDPYMNGVVDEPGEAGEPFIDMDGDGFRDINESFRNLDGSATDPNPANAIATFTQKGDRLWENDGNLNGRLDVGEFAYFNHCMGKDINASGSFVDTSGDGAYQPGEPTVHDDDPISRQLMARHLYCLMLAVMDENYLAPYDPNDPQVAHYLDPLSAGSMANLIRDDLIFALQNNDLPGYPWPGLTGDVNQDAKIMAMRKLTCRQVAQWAINVVDMRDPDAIQTPFEYDENPWDGWNVRFRRTLSGTFVDEAGAGSGASIRRVYPIDGDIATDENCTMIRGVNIAVNPPAFAAARAEIRSPSSDNPNNPVVGAPAYMFDQTRGVVWGAERPELLMTEGLAWHDRRLVDRNLDAGAGLGSGEGIGGGVDDSDDEDSDEPTIDNGLTVGGSTAADPNFNSEDDESDNDLDQALKPAGPAYVELHNPWGPDDQKPAEFYRDPGYVLRRYDSTGDGLVDAADSGVEGVLLDRLSGPITDTAAPNFGGVNPAATGLGPALNSAGQPRTDVSAQPSPVWRIACVETHPLLRNTTMPQGLGDRGGDYTINDDPRNRKNAPGGNQATYLDITIENGPWQYRTDNPADEGALTATAPSPDPYVHPLAPTGEGRDRSRANVLPRAFNEFWDARADALDEYIGRIAGAIAGGQQINSTTEPAITNTDPDFPTFDRAAQPFYVGRYDQLLSLSTSPNAGISGNDESVGNQGGGFTGSTEVTEGFTQNERVVLRKPDNYIERVFYLAGAPARRGKLRIGYTRDAVDNPGVRIPRLFYDTYLPAQAYESISDEDSESAGSSLLSLEAMGLERIGGRQPRLRVHASRFVVLDELDIDGDFTGDENLNSSAGQKYREPMPIAPILPGHYGVVGHAGTIYGKDLDELDANTLYRDDRLINRYTNIVSRTLTSRAEGSSEGNLQGEEPVGIEPVNPGSGSLNQFRRVELIPSVNPFRQQVVWRYNGAPRDEPRWSEVVSLDPESLATNGYYTGESEPYDPTAWDNGIDIGMVNVTDPNRVQVGYVAGDPNDGRSMIKPTVAIPVEGFSISEPLDGYLLRQAELDPTFGQWFIVPKDRSNSSDDPAEGSFRRDGTELGGYDEPFDVLPELIENQTTPNYRALHLQRLANPLLAWNPPPLRPDGRPYPGHDPSRPVNPYMTVDTISLDLTSLNGTSDRERELPTSPDAPSSGVGPEVRHWYKREFVPGASGSGSRGDTRVTLQSQERGLHQYVAGAGETLLPARALWGQERPSGVTEILYQLGYPLTERNKMDTETGNLRARFRFGDSAADNNYDEHYVDYPIRHSLGFPNRNYGKFYNHSVIVRGFPSQFIDINGDGNPAPEPGELVGTPQVDLSNPTTQDDVATPSFFWPNRPFISEMEVLQAPAWGSSRMLTYYSTFNPNLPTQPNPYDGEAIVLDTGERDFGSGMQFVANDPNVNDTDRLTNAERWSRATNPYGHLLPFFQTAEVPAQLRSYRAPYEDENGDRQEGDPRVVAFGAPHFYRILDYLYVPSRFAGTDELLNTSADAFGANGNATSPGLAVGVPLDDPRRDLLAPFNRIDNYREPGQVNLNTIVGRHDAVEFTSLRTSNNMEDAWSEVYDGLMHRRRDGNYIADVDRDRRITPADRLGTLGHLGPAWRDMMVSRRGYAQTSFDGIEDFDNHQNVSGGVGSGERLNYASRLLNPNFPTFFANPMRAPGSGDAVPIEPMRQFGVDSSWLRSHPIFPGADNAWGERGRDDATCDRSGLPSFASDGIADGDFHLDDADEAGSLMAGFGVFRNPGRTIANLNIGDFPSVREIDPRSGVAGGAIPDTLKRGTSLNDNPNYTSDDLTSDEVQAIARTAPIPLFAGASGEVSLAAERNPSVRYQPMTRLANLTTYRSGAFAVWITVGFFEVQPARQVPQIAARYFDPATDTDDDGIGEAFRSDLGSPADLEDLFFRIYQDGYTIGQELDLETGQNRRMKGFYIIDRTQPVAFKPGEDLNVENAVLLRRRVQ